MTQFLVPDIHEKLVPYACKDDATYTPAAIAEDKSFALVYVSESVPVYINPNVLCEDDLYQDNPDIAGTGDVKVYGTSNPKMMYRLE